MRNNHAALTRTDTGGLDLRWFPTAAAAAEVAKDREIAPPKPARGILVGKLAQELGLHPRTVRRAWQNGQIPGVELSARRLLIPRDACNLIKTYGLGGYIRRIAAGRH
ncbi:MAG: hypothetical protein B9S38_02325 [Verrucomicrobiia bacterium Tous-C4TDCM]|nr:MAG: hypothetical protein B9S38_02325 [Verrucomicrobiae bacterium Tous-C4TDCM]